MNVGFINTGLKRINARILSDGVFFISPKASSKNVLGVIELSFNDYASLINEPLTKNANQCFFIKYNDDEDYYTIIPLHSHQFIGVEPKEDGNYNFSLICQTAKDDNYLIQWKINLCDDSYFNIQLKDTDFVFEFQKDLNFPVLNEKSDTDNQKFMFKTAPTIKSGIYKINLKIEPKSFVSLPNNSKDATFEEENKKNYNDHIFSVTYDSIDGCYSIVNLESMNCLSSFKGSKEKSFVSQSYFFGVDFQRWIIGTYQSKNSDFFIELKSNLLRLGAGEKINFQFVPLILEKFDKNQPLKSKQIFNFKLSNYKNFNECKKYQGFVEEGIKFRYTKEFNMPMELQYDKWVIFENCHFLTNLQFPISVQRIPEKAFVDLKRIKVIDCDPKWIKLFPNPLNIENVIVPNGVEVIEEDSFKELQNLKVLSLPPSLKTENFDPNVFKDFYDLRRFEGNPIFLKFIHKSSLELVFIPSWVDEIPDEAFIGCKYLAEIKIEDNSKMKRIKARAFANCHSLQSFKVPESVINIAPSAFNGCNDLFKPELTNDQQRFSLVESLVIESELTKITENYKMFCNIQSLEIPLTTDECDPNVLNSYKHLSFVKCNPKWLNSFITENIQAVFIPEGISQIEKDDFEKLIHLKYLEIPTSVEFIEENAFSTCNELTSAKCCLKHLQFLNQKQIKELIINDIVTKIYRNHFESFINLESIELPDTIEYIGPNAFVHCKKLVNVNNELAEKLINNKVLINDSQKVIIKDEFEGWTNLQFLEIPDSVEEIEEGTFDECINLEHIKCDPKWFIFMPKNSIREITIPDFVEELNMGEFDGLYSLTKLELPENIVINDPNIFDSCESLIIINCENSLFKRLSKKTRKRCTERKVLKYVKPVYDFQPDKTKVHDETMNLSKNLKNDDDDDVQENKYKPAKEMDFDDLIKYDERFEQYRKFIDNVYRIQEGELPKVKKPNNTSMDEISKVCGIVCHRIKKEYKITPRPVQILAILCLCDEILNNKESHGAIAQIKTGEGKTIIISILSIILVKYNRKIDIVTSNLELAKRDQKEQSKYFSLFGIITGVLYHVEQDQDFLTKSMINYVDESQNNDYKDFNIKVLNNPVVYSTSSNYEFVYLYSLFNLSSRKREFDVVLIDEVDNMFIDQSDSPAMIARNINYAYSRDILEIVFHLHYWKTSEIIKTLKYYLPNAGEFKEKDIELLKNAALNAVNRIKDIDYIIENNEIVIIDQDTGFKRNGVHWAGFVHEMVQIKEGIEISESSQSFCQITNHAYFNLYNKIAGVTGTIGSIGDAELLQKGYKVDIFKFPRHYISQMEVYLKKRPDKTKLYEYVARDIKKEVSKGRPVLVIWDSIYHADHFLESKPKFQTAQKITAVDPASDRESIRNAGNLETVTIATSAAGRGVDIKLSQESLNVGGLHVIIPNCMRNQRSLEQAVGRAGRQGQPGSVTIFISENDQYEKVHQFKKRDENLVKIEHRFWNYLKKNYSWVFNGPSMYGLQSMPVFPYSCDYSVIMNILARMISFTIYKNPITMGIQHKLICDIFKDLCMYMISTAWGNFFNALFDDDSNQIDDIDYCNQSYEHFINEFHKWFNPNKCTSALSALLYMKFKLIKEMDMEYVIVNGIKITSFLASVVFPEAAPKIELLGGIVLNGGLEVYHKLQNGDKINWAQVLICVGGHAIKSLIKQNCGINDPYKNSRIDICVDIAESLLYNLADSLVVNEKKKPKFPPLPTSIKAFAIGTEKWIVSLIKEKLKIQPTKPKKISNFKPKCIIPQLKASFIRKTMKIASEAYDGKFSTGEVLKSSELNEKYKPKFYCLEDSNDLYVAVRGTDSFFDIETDGSFAEVKENLNGKDIYFHIGFYNAAKYILENVIYLFTQKNYENIYFVGHSYGASVSSVLCLLTKSQDKFKDKNIYSMSFAPAPSMSECPSNIAKCIFAFIHHNDFVPHFSGLNFINTISIYGHKIIQKYEKILSFVKNEYLKKLIKFVIKNADAIVETSELLHVRKVKGVIFAIGLTDATSLNDCRIVEYDLPNTMILEISSFNDHRMVNYIKVFEKFDY